MFSAKRTKTADHKPLSSHSRTDFHFQKEKDVSFQLAVG